MLLPLLLAVCALIPARAAHASVVVAIESVVGPIELELFDAVAPLTVANFLGYADSAGCDQSFIHRSVPAFVIHGGGYRVVADPITLVAMAKLGGQPNSARTTAGSRSLQRWSRACSWWTRSTGCFASISGHR